MKTLLLSLIAIADITQIPVANGQSTVPHRLATPLSPGAQRVVDAFTRQTADLRARFAAMPDNAPLRDSLDTRISVEQGLRKDLPDLSTSGLSEADRAAASARIWTMVGAVDDANTAWLKTVLPADGWFHNSRDGADVASNAWLIVQHSPDRQLQREVLARMEPLAKAGEVNGSHYALLYDRVEMFAGRPQYYGSQFDCRNHHWALAPMRDAAGVDARREAIGMEPLAAYVKEMNDNGGC